MRYLTFIFIFWIPPLASSSSLRAATGPLLTRSESVGQLFRLNPPVMSPKLLSSGAIKFDLSRTYANLWAKDNRYLIDSEIVDDQARFVFGLPGSLQAALSFSSRRFVKADTDQMAISFHDLFRLGQDGRLEAGKHHTRFAIPDYSLEYTSQNIDRSFSEQGVFDLSYALLNQANYGFDLSFSGLIAYELADSSPYRTGAFDRGLILSSSYQRESMLLFANIRHIEYSGQQDNMIGTRPVNRGWALGVSYDLPMHSEVIWQFMNNQPVFVDLGQLSRNSYEWQIGYRYKAAPIELELAIIENVFWVYNSPDWGFTIGMHSAIR